MSVSWVWPQLEAQTPPPIGEFDAGFGPVYLNDQITLLFSPSSYTGEFTWYCDWSDTEQGAFWNIPNPSGSPLTYTFNETTPDPNDLSDVHTCHFYNLDGTIGNSQTFQYFNFPGNSRTLWTQSGPSSIPANQGSSSGSGSGSGSSPSSPSSSPTRSNTTPSSTGNNRSKAGPTTGTSEPASATNSPTNPSGTSSVTSGSSSSSTASTGTHPDAASSANAETNVGSPPPALSTGAAVGITIAAIVVALAIGLLAFFLRRRLRQAKQPREPSVVGTEVNRQHGAGATGQNGTVVGQHGGNMAEYFAPPPTKPASGPSMQQNGSWNRPGMGGVAMVPGRSELSSE